MIRPSSALGHLLGDSLGQQQRPGDVDLELVADVGAGNVDGRSALPNAGVVDQDLDAPSQRLAPVAVVGDVELLDLEGHSPLDAWRLSVCIWP